MKKQIFLTALCVAMAVPTTAIFAQNQNFDNGWIGERERCTLDNAFDVTEAKLDKNGHIRFKKPEWKNKLCLKKQEQKRTFTSIDKVVTWNLGGDCVITYTVNNGEYWDSQHPFWKSGIQQYDQCGEVWAPNPKAIHKEWAVNSKIYKYDETAPNCGVPEFYDEKDSGNKVSYEWGWTSKSLYVQFKCEDTLSGCDWSYSERVKINHLNETVNVTFKDNVGNSKTQTCSLGFNNSSKNKYKYKFDQTAPKADIAITDTSTGDDNLPKVQNNTSTSININKDDEVNLFAWEKTLQITITDPERKYDDKNTEGISGVKEVDLSVKWDGKSENSCFIKQTNIEENENSTEASKKIFAVTCDFTKKWTYILTLNYKDQADNVGQKIMKTIKVVPNNNIALVIDEVTKQKNHEGDNIYANAFDKYVFKMHIEDSNGNRINDKVFENFQYTKIPSIEGNSNSSNAISKTGWFYSNEKVTNNNGDIGKISFTSSVPGELKTTDFTIDLPKWDEKYQNIKSTLRKVHVKGGDKYIFHPPFKAKMKLLDDDSIVFGQKQTLQFDFESISNDLLRQSNIKNIKVDVTSWLKNEDTNEWKMNKIPQEGWEVKYVNNIYTVVKKLDFLPEQIAKKINTIPNIIATPLISYTIWNQGVSYKVGNEFEYPIVPLSLSWWEVNKIFIGGQEQAQGKQEFVSDTSKLGNNSWVTARNAITREVAELTRNRQSNGSVINGVKYVLGDKELFGEVKGEYKTLIVEDGNITFKDNFNTNKENIAIILINKKDKNKSKIFIKPNVAFISALIFAENSIESVDADGNPFAESNRTRTQTLSKQIVFHGGLYTRNTIGGAVAGTTGKYVLPGNVETTNIHDAVRYDLSFLRMKADGRDDDSHTKKFNQGRTESVVVWPNIEGLTNPPPGFRLK